MLRHRGSKLDFLGANRQLRANYFFRPAIYVIKMVPRFELPRFEPKPPTFANCSLQLPRQTSFTDRTLSRSKSAFPLPREATKQLLGTADFRNVGAGGHQRQDESGLVESVLDGGWSKWLRL